MVIQIQVSRKSHNEIYPLNSNCAAETENSKTVACCIASSLNTLKHVDTNAQCIPFLSPLGYTGNDIEISVCRI